VIGIEGVTPLGRGGKGKGVDGRGGERKGAAAYRRRRPDSSDTMQEGLSGGPSLLRGHGHVNIVGKYHHRPTQTPVTSYL